MNSSSIANTKIPNWRYGVSEGETVTHPNEP